MILYVFSMFWALLALGAFFYILNHPGKFEKVASPILLLVIVGLCIRIIPAFFLVPGSNHDIESYRLVGQHVLRFEDVYTAEDSINRHPYLPFQMYWIGFSLFLSSWLPFPFVSLVRLAPIMADIFISLVIYFVIKGSSTGKSPLWAGLLYAVNPISMYVSAYHGQFDAIPILLILLAILSARNKAPASAGFWLGLGILVKSWPILALPSLFYPSKIQNKKIQLLIFSGLVPSVGILVYCWLFDARIFTVIKRAISYNHGIGVWGYTYLLRMVGVFWQDALTFLTPYFSLSKYVTLLVLFVVWFFVARRQNLLAGMLTILLALLAFSHAFSIQYLAWLIPFAILDHQHRWLKRYTIAAFGYMFLAYHTLILRMTITQLMPWPQADLYLIIPAGLAAWLVTVAWAWDRVFAGRTMAVPQLSFKPK